MESISVLQREAEEKITTNYVYENQQLQCDENQAMRFLIKIFSFQISCLFLWKEVFNTRYNFNPHTTVKLMEHQRGELFTTLLFWFLYLNIKALGLV